MKTVEEIYNEMLAVFRQKTGAEASAVSDLSVKLYAVAAQVYGLYVQADWLARQCFPQSAQGAYLERHAALRGLSRRGAAEAGGKIRFLVDEPATVDLTIPAGTVCATAGLVRFETVESGVLKTGETWAEVPAQALEPGEGGNVPAGSILVMVTPPVGISRCVNPESFSGGADPEGDDSLRDRVLETYRRMPNGANAAFYENQALSFDQVAACEVLPRNRGRGTVDVVISSSAGLPSAELIQDVQDHLEACREIAVDVLVKSPETKLVNVSAAIRVKEGADSQAVKADAERAIRGYFSGERLSEDISVGRLYQLLLSREGIENAAITVPAADVSVEKGELPQLGTLTVGVTA